MAESSACLVRSFSVPSPTSIEEEKQNSIKRALTSSVSFGRFMSESLDWERFSAFNQKRYLEEAERYSKPGSVAEKKAYFEAHYKRKRAAALIGEKNAEPSNIPETNATNNIEDNSPHSESAHGESSVVSEKTKEEEEVLNRDTIVSVSQREFGDSQLQGVEQVNKPMILMETSIELMDHLENDEYVFVSNQEDKASQDVPSMNISEFTSEEKREVSSTNLLKNSTATQQVPPPPPPTKPIMPPVLLGNEEKATLNCKNNARDSSNKKRSTSTSLHMSINFAPCYGETQNATSPRLPKNANSRFNRTPVKKSSNSFLRQALTRASVNSICNTSSENRNVMTHTHGHSIQGGIMVDGKLQSMSTSYFKSSSTLGSKARSLTVSSSFTFKSEERAAKRKEKLEQKLKSNEPDKRPHAKPQVKARNELKDHLKATKYTNVPPKVDSSRHFTKKTLNVTPLSPKIKERVPFKVQDNGPRPPWRFSMKVDSSKDVVKGKNNRPPICSAKSFPKKSTCENSSPNVQI